MAIREREQTKGKTRAVRTGKGTVAFVGAGRLASFLAPALAEAGFRIGEVVARDRRGSIQSAQRLARRVGARAKTIGTASLGAEVLWLAVPDGEIRGLAESLANRVRGSGTRFAFHSSGALGSRELEALRKAGLAVASVHPLMTFVPGTKPSLSGVPFAVEGEARATGKAREIVQAIGGKSFAIGAGHKAAYHAWATMTSPLLLAYFVVLEQAAGEAGVGREKAKQMSLAILRQTLENYARKGAAESFTGPFVRGDSETVAKHLDLLAVNSRLRAVYVALARVALEELPVRNRKRIGGMIGVG